MGLSCLRSLWVSMNKPEMMPKPSPSSLHRMKQGIEVGEKATLLFPSGIDCGVRGNVEEEVKKTKENLKKKVPLFEPGFQVDNCYARADILAPVEGGWDLYEVKSSTKVKDDHIHDVAFQKYVYERAGLKIKRCFLMHTNNKFVRDGDIDWSSFFAVSDITDSVSAAETLVPDLVEEMLDIIKDTKQPSPCESPKSCKAPELCWGSLEEGNVFELTRGGAKAISLFESGITQLKDIPSDFKLTSKQKIQVDCAVSGKVHKDDKKIKEFVSSLEYPLYFMDFEAFQTCIPLIDGTSPYAQIPFQFSIHIQEKPNGPLKHIEFLHSGVGDPRKEFTLKLQQSLGDKGSILAYHKSFETDRLKELESLFPEYTQWFRGIYPRIVDLRTPFANFDYYNPVQHGATGLKVVLPAVTGKGYKHLNIQGGIDAAIQFLEIVMGKCKDVEKVRKDLLLYCGLDTEGMVWILEKVAKRL